MVGASPLLVCRLRAPHPTHPRATRSTARPCSRGVGAAREIHWGRGSVVSEKEREREERETKMIYMEKKIKI
jgi:hypothetical protein